MGFSLLAFFTKLLFYSRVETTEVIFAPAQRASVRSHDGLHRTFFSRCINHKLQRLRSQSFRKKFLVKNGFLNPIWQAGSHTISSSYKSKLWRPFASSFCRCTSDIWRNYMVACAVAGCEAGVSGK